MSPYATELAEARLDALRTLIDALSEAETPDEKRRCAVAIFNAPDPCDLDDSREYTADGESNDDEDDANANDSSDTEAIDELPVQPRSHPASRATHEPIEQPAALDPRLPSAPIPSNIHDLLAPLIPDFPLSRTAAHLAAAGQPISSASTRQPYLTSLPAP